MKRSKDISLFKIALFLCIALYFGDHLIAAVFFVLLLIDNRKDAFLFLVLYVLLFFLNSLRYDLIPIGIAEERRNGYVIVDKFFYKSIVFDDGGYLKETSFILMCQASSTIPLRRSGKTSFSKPMIL